MATATVQTATRRRPQPLGNKPVLVTYRRRVSGRQHQMAFDCGDGEMHLRLILREAWNTRSEVLRVERFRSSKGRA